MSAGLGQRGPSCCLSSAQLKSRQLDRRQERNWQVFSRPVSLLFLQAGRKCRAPSGPRRGREVGHCSHQFNAGGSDDDDEPHYQLDMLTTTTTTTMPYDWHTNSPATSAIIIRLAWGAWAQIR